MVQPTTVQSQYESCRVDLVNRRDETEAMQRTARREHTRAETAHANKSKGNACTMDVALLVAFTLISCVASFVQRVTCLVIFIAHIPFSKDRHPYVNVC